MLTREHFEVEKGGDKAIFIIDSLQISLRNVCSMIAQQIFNFIIKGNRVASIIV